jgi:ubiquinol-cytochrome c reductase iron-sulfur subunit
VKAPGSRSEKVVGVAFAISALASLGLTVTYLRGGQPQIEGALLGVALGGLSAGIIGWARCFMPKGAFVEERKPRGSEAEQEAIVRELEEGDESIGRRRFLAKMLGASIGALGLVAVFPIRSLGPSPGSSLFNTAWRRGSRLVVSDGRPVATSDLAVGGVVTVFPQGHAGSADSQALLIRTNPQDLVPLSGREDWAPEGFVAFSKICTHAGCPVGLYEADTGSLFCPCHQSVFDVSHWARPTSGPATRPLPQLPIEVDADGFLVARGDFSDPVGPSFWSRERKRESS